MHQGIGLWAIQGTGWLLLLYLIYAQGSAAIDCERGIARVTEKSHEQITEDGLPFSGVLPAAIW